MTTHTAPRLDQNSTGRMVLIRAGAMADGSAWLGDFRSVTAQLLWHDLTKDDSSLSQCQRPGRLLVQPVHQRGGVKILDGRTGPPKGCVRILLRLQARPIDRHRRRIPGFGGEKAIPIERGVECRYVLYSPGAQTFQVPLDEIALRRTAHLRFQAGAHPVGHLPQSWPSPNHLPVKKSGPSISPRKGVAQMRVAVQQGQRPGLELPVVRIGMPVERG